MQPAILTEGLSKFYGKSIGIDGVDLSINQGERYGFIGPNGAGKSTTIRTLLNLLHKSSGKAKILGMDTDTHHVEVMKRIGYLPGYVSYYADMTSKELLQYSSAFYKVPLGSRYQELCERFQLDTSKHFSDLSLGNKKKVAIIQSVLHRPEVLIMDEPTSGLDPLMQNEFFNLLEEEHQRGATIFLSTHILSDVQRFCNRVSIIKSGKIIATEDVTNLLSNQFKSVHMRFTDTIDPNHLGLAGATEIRQQDHTMTFSYRGDIKPLLARLGELPVVDVSITEPTLEQIFMHYYERE